MSEAALRALFAVLLTLSASIDADKANIDAAVEMVRTALAPPAVVIPVPAHGNLQATLNTAPGGAIIALDAGAEYVGNFRLPKHTGAPITLTTYGHACTPGRRATEADSGSLAIFRSPSTVPAIRLEPGANDWIIACIEVAPPPDPRGSSLNVGNGDEKSLDQYPVNVTVRGVLVRGDIDRGLKRCINLHGVNLTLEDSYAGECKVTGQDSQALWAEGPGPYLIRNNYLEGASENLLFGGDATGIQDLVPSDITIVGNTFSKPLAWRAQKWNVKNLLELKNARRVLIEHNEFERNWPDGQAGYAILFTPKNQYGTEPWATVEDVTFRHNTIRDVSSAINVTGVDSDGQVSARMTGLRIEGNHMVVNRTTWGGDGRCLQVGGGPQQLAYTDNVCVSDGPTPFYTYGSPASQGFRFERNHFLFQKYGFSGACEVSKDRPAGCTGVPLAVLGLFYPGATFTGNVIGGGKASAFPDDNQVITVDAFKARFIDYAGGDVRLQP